MSRLYEDESLESLISGQPKLENRRRCSGRIVFVAIITIINLLALTIILVISATTPSRAEQSDMSDWLSCGNTSAEAVENGCFFDSMLSAWLHPDCYNAEHYSSTLQTVNPSFFLNINLTGPYTAKDGDWPQQHLYTDIGYHSLHCTYMWERQIMAWTTGSKIDSISWNLPHTKHCMMTVLTNNELLPPGTVSKLTQGFPGCGRPSW